MKDIWFAEDRKQAKEGNGEYKDLKAESEKALKNSTLFSRRLGLILDDLIAETERSDEDFSKPNWELTNVANISRRRTLREIKNLIQL